MPVAKIIGAVGLVLIALGIIIKKRRTQDMFYILGGLCLEIYSLTIKDTIFIILQILFTLAAVYDYSKTTFQKH